MDTYTTRQNYYGTLILRIKLINTDVFEICCNKSVIIRQIRLIRVLFYFLSCSVMDTIKIIPKINPF